MQKINEIIIELLKNNIAVTNCSLINNSIAYEIQIGSKTGIGLLFTEEDKIFLKTRYNQIDEIKTFDDISSIAYEWFLKYNNHEPFIYPDSYWVKVWVIEGRIEEKKNLLITYRIK